jgi:hypothetical protein
VYQRIVCFKFKENATEEAIRQHMDGFKQLKDAIPQIVAYSGGLAVSGDRGATPDYDSLHILTFASLEDIEQYFHHDRHQRFIQKNREIWNKVLVLNAHVKP